MLGMSLIYSFPVRITSWDVDRDIKSLNSMNISIDNVTRSNGSIIVDAKTEHEFQAILANGFDAIKLPNPIPELARQLNEQSGRDPQPQNQYYTLDQYHAFMIQTAAQYPNICSLVQVGTSLQNRPIYFLKISDNVNVAEPEPRFKFISSIHGDEVVGYDLLIRMIQLLTSEYGNTMRITELVNNTEIWICPMMNPDGMALGQRYNAAGIDLNRNFPMPTGVLHPDGNNWQQENIAIMDFGNAHNFQLSINYHGGALVMNYPWDYTYALAPDNNLLIQASLAYSTHNQPMYNSTEFPQGISNGAAWYVITGSMQDWNYGLTDCMDITCEVSNVKWPAATQLPTYWAQNQESMLSYMEFVHRGIHGMVSSPTGTPLNASITVAGNAKVMHTSPLGDYHRLLLPGTYSVTASATGYIPQTVTITVPASGSTTYDFVLAPAQMTNLVGQVRAANGFGVGQMNVRLDTDPPLTAITDPNGVFTFDSVYEGRHTITVSDAEGVHYQKAVDLSVMNNRVVLPVPSPLFTDDFESGLGNWTATSPWAIALVSGNNVLTDSPSGNYGNNVNRSVRFTNPINLNNIQSPVLSFRTKYDLEAGYDFVYVEGSVNNVSWTEIGSFTGTQSNWTDVNFSLQNYANSMFFLRFRLRSDTSVNADGIYIDDVRIIGYSTSTLAKGDTDGNWVIDLRDVQAVLDYSVGLDALPEIDPLPWDTQRLAACDVDLSSAVDVTDASLILRYIDEPSYRFEAQSGVAAVFPPSALIYTPQGQNHLISFSPAGSARCFSAEISPMSAVTYSQISVSPAFGILTSTNPGSKVAVLSRQEDLAWINFALEATAHTLNCDYILNGIIGQVFLSMGSANDDPAAPAPVFDLQPNYPNPFNPSTSFRYAVTDADIPTTLVIYNLKGQMVRSLVNAIVPAGLHKVEWDGRDKMGRPVASGVYLYRLQQGKNQQTRKMILAK